MTITDKKQMWSLASDFCSDMTDEYLDSVGEFGVYRDDAEEIVWHFVAWLDGKFDGKEQA